MTRMAHPNRPAQSRRPRLALPARGLRARAWTLAGLAAALVFSPLACSPLALARPAPDDLQWADDAAGNEAIKSWHNTAVEGINLTLRQFSEDEAVRKLVTDELRAAGEVLQHNADAARQFWADLRRIGSRDELHALIERKGLRAHAANLVQDYADGLAGQGDAVLRRIVAHSDAGVDLAGREALDLLQQAKAQLAKNGSLSKELNRKLADALAKLPSERALAGHRLLRNQFAVHGVSGFDMFTRGGMDTAFALLDINRIRKLETAEERAAAASGTIASYGLETAANVGVRVLGGGLFLHGLVVSLSAAAVGEMLNEMILLHYDLENTALAEQQVAIAARANVLQGLLRTDELIKAGKLAEARSYLTKLRHFYQKRDEADDRILARLLEFDRHLDAAADQLQANRIIAEARVHYDAGYGLARKGRQLRQAREHLLDASKILEDGHAVYPILRPALEHTRRVIGLVERLLAEAAPLQRVVLSGPEAARAGDWVSFSLLVVGGVPDFTVVGADSMPAPGGAIANVRAPDTPGTHPLAFTVRDHLGRSVSAHTTLRVLAAADTPPPAADTSCEGTVFDVQVTHADRSRTRFAFLLMPRDEVVRLARERAGKALQEHEIERVLTQTFRSSMPDHESQAAIAAAMPKRCHALLSKRQLFIMWHGTRTETNAAGSTRYQAEFRNGYRVRTLVEPTPEPAAAGRPVGGVPVGGGFAPR